MTSVDAQSNPVASEARERPQVSVMLVDARESKGLTQKEVADQLYLTATFIRYIDDGDFQKIPKPAFIKGYLRSYGRVVGLSGDEIIAAYDRELDIAPQTPAIGNVTEETVGSGNFTGPVVQTGVIGLGVIALVVALVWWLGSSDAPAPVVMPAVDDVEDAAEDLDVIAPGVFEAIEEAGSGPGADTLIDPSASRTGVPAPLQAPGASTPDAISIQLEQDTAVNEPVAEPATQTVTQLPTQTMPEDSALPKIKAGVEIDRTRDGETQYITVYGGGDSELEFAFIDDCWIRVKDGEGEIIYGDLNRAGDVMTVYGISPFEVLVGKVPAVSMTYEGRAIDLSRSMTSDQTAIVRTARL